MHPCSSDTPSKALATGEFFLQTLQMETPVNREMFCQTKFHKDRHNAEQIKIEIKKRSKCAFKIWRRREHICLPIQNGCIWNNSQLTGDKFKTTDVSFKLNVKSFTVSPKSDLAPTRCVSKDKTQQIWVGSRQNIFQSLLPFVSGEYYVSCISLC